MTERIVLAFGVGAACLSTLVFALCAAGWAQTPALLAATACVAIAMTRVSIPGGAMTKPSRGWWLLTGSIAIPFAVLYVVNAAAPEISPDGSGYHLGVVRRYLNHGGFYRVTTNMLANFPQACEMLFLAAYAVGRHSAAALTHCAFLLALPLALISYGRRFGLSTAGAIAALLVFVAPVAGVSGTSAYVDVALSFSGFLTFYFLEMWAERRSDTLLAFAGLLAGFCFAIKYTGVVAAIYAVGFVALKARGWKPLLALLAPAAIVALPWLVKNWAFVHNPLSPFFNRAFPNPYVHIALEDEFRDAMRHFNGARLGWRTPFDLALGGGLLQGTIGPAFLLAPAGLAAVRDSRGPRVLAAAALFALPWFSNIGARFLLPALPFVALALGMALSRWPKIAMAVVAANAALCWPDALARYCDLHAWRITGFPLAAALRIVPEERFLEANAPDIRFARLIQDHVPAEGVVYTAQPIMEAYTDRTILLNYTSALSQGIEDVLGAVIKPAMQPSQRLVFRFEPREIRGLRFVAGADAADWTIHEIEHPSPRGVEASLNAWDAGKAADGQVVTAWRAWQPVPRNSYFEADFGGAVRTDFVAARSRPGGTPGALRLQVRSAAGEWTTLSAAPEIQPGVPLPDLRGEAMAEVARAGATHLLIHDREPLGPDFQAHERQWNARLTASAPPMRLYEIVSLQPARDFRPRDAELRVRPTLDPPARL